jgi:uncharacterized protein (TIGR03435 family)
LDEVMLRFLAISVLTVSTLGQIPPSVPSESSAVVPRFQVATIKPSRPEESRSMQYQGNRFITTDTSVVDLLKYAYGLHEQEIVGDPKWLTTQKFDLVGDSETLTKPSADDFKKMVRSLLADRFHLTAHHETKNLPVFAIVPAKGGPKLTKSARPPDGPPSVAYSPGQLSAGNATMADFATFLQRFVTDQPVFDRTGIAGKYDMILRWTPDELQTEASRQGDDNNNSLPSLFTAVQEQLGLKLQEEKLPAQALVVDHVDMPSEN